jgi:hypothetical protein
MLVLRVPIVGGTRENTASPTSNGSSSTLQSHHFEGPMQPTRLISAAIACVARAPHARISRRVAATSAFALVAIAAACSSDSSTSPSKTVAGAYPMATVRGLPVPHTFTDAKGSKLTIEGGSIIIDTDGSYQLKYKGKLNALTFDLTDEGTYTLSGSTVSFTPDDGDAPYTGRVEGKSVLVNGFRIAGAGFDLRFSSN